MIEKKLRGKIAQLIDRAVNILNVPKPSRDSRWATTAQTWLTETVNVIALALPPDQTYRQHINWAVNDDDYEARVTRTSDMLGALLRDIDAGLVSTLTNAIRAETFDNFLDHAVAYRDRGGKDQAGVIAGVVFEDTMRKIYADKIDKVSRPELEQVIIALTKQQVITDEQAKQARVAAYVRTKASHADWDGFSMGGVDDTIKITKALIEAHLK